VKAAIETNRQRPAMLRKTLAVVLLWCVCLTPARAFTGFTIEDIRVDGLQRISAGTVFNYLPVKVGDTFTATTSQDALQALFKTGFFSDVRLARRANVLIVEVVERPAIAKISFDGNKSMETEQLNEALKVMGVAEGRVFDRALLDKIELELQRQYFSQGRYAARIETTVTPQERNRVQIHFDIAEGDIAKIRRINIIGNHSFKDKTLLDQFELGATTLFSFFTGRDQYSRQKLAGDLESLRSYYLDRGFINFNIESTQVSITPDRQSIYVTINLNEGEQYTVEKIHITGNLIVPEADLRDIITLKTGELFSGKEVSASNEALAERIGDEGYAFANVNAVPEVIPGTNSVTLTFFIDPGKRVYVRRINFAGNTRTRDEVLRREMRQMEGGWASTRHIKRSRTRLERLGYFEEVNVETKPVPGVSDQVDIQYTVIERPSGNLMAGIGYGQTQGVMFNASISQDNFLGSGKKVSLEFNNSQINTVYSFAYNDPYFTIDGLSQGFQLYYKTTDAAEANLSRYVTDAYGFNLNYGLPTSEFNSIYLGFEPQHIKLKTTDYSPREVHEYIDVHGDSFNIFKFTGSWAHDTRNRALFPNQGTLKSFNAEVAVPGGDLNYYKVSYRHRWYLPLSRHYTLLLKGEVAYGDGYGNSEYPFFENYTAGGPRTVRGFKENTLGPEDSDSNPLGGNLKTVANMELLFPPPFAETSKSVRLSTFFDIGNVYGLREDFEAGELRYSAGLGIVWYSPLGGLTFSLARPLNKKEGDDTQFFQFSIGSTF
jgi:outer membrane protein insertion porin family